MNSDHAESSAGREIINECLANGKAAEVSDVFRELLDLEFADLIRLLRQLGSRPATK